MIIKLTLYNREIIIANIDYYTWNNKTITYRKVDKLKVHNIQNVLNVEIL